MQFKDMTSEQLTTMLKALITLTDGWLESPKEVRDETGLSTVESNRVFDALCQLKNLKFDA